MGAAGSKTGCVRLLLVHPPLLSPVVFSCLAPLLARGGHEVAVPDLRQAAATGPVSAWWQRAVDAATAAMPQAQAVLAHSGAGAVVPPLLHRLPRAAAVVLIDAVLPPADGAHATSAQVRAMVADLAVDGVLPAWTSWWPPGEMEAQVPDEGARAALAQSAPCLREALYDVDVPAQPGWEPASSSYLRLSPAYAAEAKRAAERGWRVERRNGSHLDVLTRARRGRGRAAAAGDLSGAPRLAGAQPAGAAGGFAARHSRSRIAYS